MDKGWSGGGLWSYLQGELQVVGQVVVQGDRRKERDGVVGQSFRHHLRRVQLLTLLA